MENQKGYSCVRIPSVPIPPCTKLTPCMTPQASCTTVETICEPEASIIPNPVLPVTAALATCTPLQVTQTGNTAFVTVSIPAEAVITLPRHALEIKRISKNLKITQCRFFNAPAPIIVGKPQDTPKLFIGGFVRKDIQYSEVTHQTMTTVDGAIRDFVVDIPISCVADLGTTLTVPSLQFDQQQVYEYLKTMPLPSGFSDKDKLMMGDLAEYNVISNKFLNLPPTCELIYSQINEMDDALDRVPLLGGPFEEGVFRTIQEKMVVIVQVKLTFQTVDP